MKEREREGTERGRERVCVFEYCLDRETGRQFARLIRRPASASSRAWMLLLLLQPVGAINALNAAAWCGIVN